MKEQLNLENIQKIILENGVSISIYYKDLMLKYSDKFIKMYKTKKEMYEDIKKILEQKNKIFKII